MKVEYKNQRGYPEKTLQTTDRIDEGMVRLARIELATHSLEGCCSIH